MAGAGGDEHDGLRRRVRGGVHDRVHLLDRAAARPSATNQPARESAWGPAYRQSHAGGARRRAGEEATGGWPGWGARPGRGGFKREGGEEEGGRDGMGDLPY